MPNTLSNVRTCVPLVEEYIVKRKVTVASAIKAISTENDIESAGLKASFYRNSPWLDHRRNCLLSNENKPILVWAVSSATFMNSLITVPFLVVVLLLEQL